MVWKLGDVASLGVSHRQVTEVKLGSLCSAFNHALIESFIKEVYCILTNWISLIRSFKQMREGRVMKHFPAWEPGHTLKLK